MTIRISRPEDEGILQASKWLSFRVLLDEDELENLLSSLPPFAFYNVSNLVTLSAASFSLQDFLSAYRTYITSIKQGKSPEVLKPLFSSVMTTTEESLYAFPAKADKYILKPLFPVVQLSHHHFSFSPENQTFHSMIHSQNAISWGLQFSYPQIFSNSIKGDVIEVLKNPEMPNTDLFRTLSKWMRHYSRPTPFYYQGKRINATFRIGKQCLSWIHQVRALEPLEVKL